MTDARVLIGRTLRWALWVFMNTVGHVAAIIAFYVVYSRSRAVAAWNAPESDAVVMGAIAFGVTFGALQWLAIMDRVPAWWILASAAGYAVVVALIGVAVVAGGFDDTGIAWIVVIAIGGAIAGAVVGTMQWLVLRRRFAKAGWWVLASAIGRATSLGILAAAFYILSDASGSEMLGVYIVFLIILSSLGTVTGAITGLALVWLLQNPLPGLESSERPPQPGLETGDKR